MLRSSSSPQFMKLEDNGHFKVYEWRGSDRKEVADILTRNGANDECKYPMVCGRYRLCTNGQCSRPFTEYFEQTGYAEPNIGCSATVPLSCQSSQYHSLLELKRVYYFTFDLDIKDTDIRICKQVCLQNCSCKAVLFRGNLFKGDCCLLSNVFPLTYDTMSGFYTEENSTTTFLKVQMIPEQKIRHRKKLAVILGPVLGGVIAVFASIGICFRLRAEKVEDDHLDHMPGMPTRYSYKELKAATQNFSSKLGQRGFGSVFLGTLSDGIRVAVKRLEGLRQVKKSFLAKVETIGPIQHLNLVRMIGFCAEKSHGLLVFEYMSNGSLETWLFGKNQGHTLDWQTRKKIVLGIAKELTYLHEECRQKILHLDIKPENILLNENLSPKISDFGWSKLIDREERKIVTPGYMAPEWLTSSFTEKADVYSFGVVVLEISCGRRNVDRSCLEEEMHLLSVFKDMMDKCCTQDRQENEGEMLQMMRVASWCLQSEFARRPCMSMVVKVLEGSVGDNLDHGFENQTGHIMVFLSPGWRKVAASTAAPLLASELSGPR